MNKKKTSAPEKSLPVELVWDAREERLVEAPRDERRARIASRVGQVAARVAGAIAPRNPRRAFLQGTTEKLTPEAARAFGEFGQGFVASNRDVKRNLPVEHGAGDKTGSAMDEVWSVLGTDANGRVVLARAPGLVSNNLVGVRARQHKKAWDAAQQGHGWNPPDKHPSRQDSPIGDPGSELYVVSPEDVALAVAARQDAWRPDPGAVWSGPQDEREWGMGAHDVVDEAERLTRNAAGPGHHDLQ